MDSAATDRELASVRNFFGAWVAEHGGDGAVGTVAKWLATWDLDHDVFKSITREHGCLHDAWFEVGMMDLLLEYVAHRLGVRDLKPESFDTFGVLRRHLNVSARGLIARRPRELSEIIVPYMETLLEDGRLTEEEDEQFVAFQTSLDLSYDDYLRLARPALENAVMMLQTMSVASPYNSVLVQQTDTIKTLYEIAERQARSLGHLY